MQLSGATGYFMEAILNKGAALVNIWQREASEEARAHQIKKPTNIPMDKNKSSNNP